VTRIDLLMTMLDGLLLRGLNSLLGLLGELLHIHGESFGWLSQT
jgi:hypothetical protein